MRLSAPFACGLRAARRRPGLVVLVYLVSLVPTLLVALPAWEDLFDGLGHSPFAAEALTGNRFGVWQDLSADPKADLSGALGAFLAVGLLVAVAQVLVSAGLVEVLFFREPRGEHPFLLGIGRHGWAFLRSAVWFGVAALALRSLAVMGFDLVTDRAAALGDARLQLWGWGAVLVVALALFAALDLAYDLARVAAAAHGDRRTLRGFLAALVHTLRHPLRLGSLWGAFAAAAAVAATGLLAVHGALSTTGPAELAALAALQQALFLGLAWLRVAFWGAEIGYYQAVGEPRWCARPAAP